MSVHEWGVDRQRLYIDTEVSCKSLPWLVVIHGGAWRDPNITYKSAFACLDAAKRSSNFGGLCSVDYRLSPGVQHPAHMNDVIEGIRYILKNYDPTSLVLLGHSCGAFIAGQVYPYFASKITKVICLEGIYDLSSLCREYPEYGPLFVEPAFGAHSAEWPEPSWSRVRRLKLVHSLGDELLSMKQVKWVSKLTKVPVEVLSEGTHDEVYEINFNESILD